MCVFLLKQAISYDTGWDKEDGRFLKNHLIVNFLLKRNLFNDLSSF